MVRWRKLSVARGFASLPLAFGDHRAYLLTRANMDRNARFRAKDRRSSVSIGCSPSGALLLNIHSLYDSEIASAGTCSGLALI
jgi:hypothetical protein